jgi:hypothetical protein
MAVKKQFDPSVKKIEIVCFADDCVSKDDAAYPGSTARKAYEEYLETLDETKLVLAGTPDRFVFQVGGNAEQRMRRNGNALAKAMPGLAEGDKSFNTLSMTYELVRDRLVDVISEGKSVFKKATDGKADHEILNWIAEANAFNDFSGVLSRLDPIVAVETVKKS